MEFSVRKISAWSPTRQTESGWQNWALNGADYNDPELIGCKAKKPKTAGIAAMTRRRLTLWGAMATEVACQCVDHISEVTPTIFASRHGDTTRTFELLQNIAKQEPLSPTAFSLSVHNSSSGIFSIEQKLFANALALAAGKDTLGQSFVEAKNLLEQGHSEVLLVCGDIPLVDFYLDDMDEFEQAHAVAMVLTKTSTEMPLKQAAGQATNLRNLEVLMRPAKSKLERAGPIGLSMTLQFLKFWYANQEALEFQGRRLHWSFKR